MAISSRLFFAIWPPVDWAAAAGRIAGWCVDRSGGKRVPARNMHLTLLYLGQVEAGTRGRLVEAAGELRFEPFRLGLDKVEFWPKPRILCLASNLHPPEPLLGLVEALRKAAAGERLKIEREPYVPHVTLVRKVAVLGAPPLFEPRDWLVDSFCLVESTPERGAVRYRTLRAW